MNSYIDSDNPAALIPALRYSVEMRISNSRFISTIAPAFSVAEAKDFIKEINQVYSDASHNVPVYQIGSGASLTAHASDDGEPSGTAGRPALSVLKGSGLGDTVLVITRYFGGTKLGTGGLVKAYSEAARLAINEVPKAKKISVHHCRLACPYNLYEILSRALRTNHSDIIGEDFSEQVVIEFSIPATEFDHLSSQVSELSNGQIEVHITAGDQISIIPIGK